MPLPPAPYRQAAVPRLPTSMSHVVVARGRRYFMTEDGSPFLIIGHNDAMPWPTLHALRNERDIPAVENYIKMLVENGVTVIRIMLEYCQDESWFFENPAGSPVPDMVLYWDDLIGLCERHGLRLLVQFWDTFFMSRRWEQHPYSREGSGFQGPGSFCTGEQALEAEKARVRTFIDRWGNSAAIFAYDLLNEIHPYWGGTPEDQFRWVTEIARFTKEYELARWGKRHLLTVSIFGARPDPGYDDLILRHPELDFATTHVYEYGLVDNPDNTVDCAFVMRDAVKHAFALMHDIRPYTDSESGPIHLFMDLKGQLEDAFEAEYYHNMSWGHLATGGAGSGMRWPFREPHCLTAAMHSVQNGMSRFVRSCSIDWVNFTPFAIDEASRVVLRETAGASDVFTFGCADVASRQTLIWLLRDCRDGKPNDDNRPDADLVLPSPGPGEYLVEYWETCTGEKVSDGRIVVEPEQQSAHITVHLPAFGPDLALTVTPLGSMGSST